MAKKRKNWKGQNDFQIKDGKTGKIKVKDGKFTKFGKQEAKKAKPV